MATAKSTKKSVRTAKPRAKKASGTKTAAKSATAKKTAKRTVKSAAIKKHAEKPTAKKSAAKTAVKKSVKKIDWANLPFDYMKTDKRFVAEFKNGKWNGGKLTSDDTVSLSECAGVLQYAQTCFEGLKAYTAEDGRIVTFRPNLNAERMERSCERLEMPVFPKE